MNITKELSKTRDLNSSINDSKVIVNARKYEKTDIQKIGVDLPVLEKLERFEKKIEHLFKENKFDETLNRNCLMQQLAEVNKTLPSLSLIQESF